MLSIKIMSEVWDNAPCRGGELLFLLALADQAGDADRCAWPGIKQLMRRTRSSRRSVYNYAETLQKAGVIEQIEPEVATKKIPRYVKRLQYATVVWRVKPLEEWSDVFAAGEDAASDDWEPALYKGQRGADSAPLSNGSVAARGATFARSGVQPTAQDSSTTTTNNSQKTSSTTSTTSSSRRAPRRRGQNADHMDDPVDQVFGRVSAEEQSTPTARRNPDSAWGLNGYYRDKVFIAGSGRLGQTNDVAMRKFFTDAKRQGVTPEVLRAMVDEFVADKQMFAAAKSRWRMFISNASRLQHRVDAVVAGRAPRVADYGGAAIPKSVLDEILAKYPEEVSA